jgi:hypothetical protein
VTVRWLTAFLDLPASSAGPATDFWLAVTGSTLSSRRGDRGEFATLLPADGDAYLRVQTVVGGPGGCHLDLHVDDLDTGAMRALGLGATIESTEPGLIVLRSPGGLPWCLAGHRGESRRPAPVGWSGHRSLVDQVCLDIAPSRYDDEAEFWTRLTGWERRAGSRPEFEYLVRPDGMPLRLLLQRLDRDPAGAGCRAHLDLASDDVAAEVGRHTELGAVVVHRMPDWVTLIDPAGRAYCVTRRSPDTGSLPG